MEYGTEDHVISLALEVTSSASFITERSEFGVHGNEGAAAMPSWEYQSGGRVIVMPSWKWPSGG